MQQSHGLFAIAKLLVQLHELLNVFSRRTKIWKNGLSSPNLRCTSYFRPSDVRRDGLYILPLSWQTEFLSIWPQMIACFATIHAGTYYKKQTKHEHLSQLNQHYTAAFISHELLILIQWQTEKNRVIGMHYNNSIIPTYDFWSHLQRQ